MATQIHHLIKMLNQIAANFAHETNADNAARAVADHVLRFWSPLMKKQLLEYTGSDADTLSPLARHAIDYLRVDLRR